jgi:hypothetical protein
MIDRVNGYESGLRKDLENLLTGKRKQAATELVEAGTVVSQGGDPTELIDRSEQLRE